jgi:Na+-driven multidrug efflux pump
MDQTLQDTGFALALFFGMLILLEIGRRIGSRRIAKDPEGARAGAGAVEGAVFGLLGLLIAFTFSGAALRFDTRRQLIVEETNDIGTAYLRLDLLSADAQAPLRENFRRYLDSRLEIYRKLPDLTAAKAELVNTTRLQGEIWRQAVAASHAQGSLPAAPMLLLPALNAMFDISTTRVMAAQIHPPVIIFLMLFGLALASALLAGYAMGAKSRNWLHMVGFAAITAFAIYVILDMEYPRLGLIRVDTFDQALVDLRNSMK